MTDVALPVYDSAERHRLVVDVARDLWGSRGLLRLLVGRQVVLRYKRSLLGVWWTLLNPLATMAVLWFVFSHIFRFATDVPYSVYLLSGIVLYSFFDQALIGAATAVGDNANVLTKIYVPPIVLCAAATAAAGVNLLISVGPLLVVMVISGVSIPPTIVLIVVPGALLMLLSIGIGLLLAPLAARYQDVVELTRIFLLLGLYATPVLWPPSTLPENVERVIEWNPLFHYFEVFRALLYGDAFGPAKAWAVMIGTALLALVAGVVLFRRSWPRVVAAL
jgi:ABC-type polysaccharide/polyol phosphate export permease